MPRKIDTRRELTGAKVHTSVLRVARALADLDVATLNSEAMRPVHVARDMGCEDTSQLLRAPSDQSDAHIGHIARVRRDSAQLSRSIAAYVAWADAQAKP